MGAWCVRVCARTCVDVAPQRMYHHSNSFRGPRIPNMCETNGRWGHGVRSTPLEPRFHVTREGGGGGEVWGFGGDSEGREIEVGEWKKKEAQDACGYSGVRWAGTDQAEKEIIFAARPRMRRRGKPPRPASPCRYDCPHHGARRRRVSSYWENQIAQ